jgi:NAD-dependent dihydropyrimidine dehydrogenase PreA subunit
MNRLIAANETGAALKLSLEASDSSEIYCINCPGYCENACRRKKVDQPVSIRNLQLFISQKADQDKPIQKLTDQPHNRETNLKSDIRKAKSSKRFTSHIGRLEAVELQEWLKECEGNVIRSREITDYSSAAGEAKSCMHCDCRAAGDCRLRDLAEELNVKDPRGKLVNSPIVKKINQYTGLVFENAKCIKCGLCVRLCEELEEEPYLCFIHRGFVSIISEPLTEEFDNTLRTRSKEVIEICPTGALSQFK